MARIAVVTDSAACIPVELAHRYHVHVVPLELVWNGQSYRDGIDITPTGFYRRLRGSISLPTTSQPAVGDFATLYVQLGQEVDGIVSIHVSGGLSATLQTASLAAEQACSVPVEVIDSRTGAIAEGFVVLAAARAAAAGGNLEEVTAAARASIPRVGLFITLETLEYLHQGGRIGEAAALLGSRLHIHPILYLSEGQVKVGGGGSQPAQSPGPYPGSDGRASGRTADVCLNLPRRCSPGSKMDGGQGALPFRLPRVLHHRVHPSNEGAYRARGYRGSLLRQGARARDVRIGAAAPLAFAVRDGPSDPGG